MKKLLLSLGAVAAVAAPVAAVVACSSDKEAYVQEKADATTLTTYATAKAAAADDAAVTTAKEAATTEIGANALKAIALIKNDATDKVTQVNTIIAEFVKSAGTHLLFNQAKQQKVFTFAADGKLTWSQVDANPAITFDDVTAFEHRNPAFDNVYETAQNKVLAAAGTLLTA